MRISRTERPNVPQKPHTALKVAGALTAGAAATGAILYAAKTGKLNPTEGGNKVVEAVKATLKKPADKILAASKVQSAIAKVVELKNTVAEKISPLKEKATAVKNTVTEKAAPLKEKVTEKFVSLKDKVNMIRAKHNPDLASAADKAAETFNNFVK